METGGGRQGQTHGRQERVLHGFSSVCSLMAYDFMGFLLI
jgi:hypothetical protein